MIIRYSHTNINSLILETVFWHLVFTDSMSTPHMLISISTINTSHAQASLIQIDTNHCGDVAESKSSHKILFTDPVPTMECFNIRHSHTLNINTLNSFVAPKFTFVSRGCAAWKAPVYQGVRVPFHLVLCLALVTHVRASEDRNS